MATTARHATPPVPPPVRDPFVRGPLVLEICCVLAILLPMVAGALALINWWIYILPSASLGVYAGCYALAFCSLLGIAVVAYLSGTLVASKLAAAGVLAELTVRRLVRAVRARRAADTHPDAGHSTPLLVATLVIAAIIIAGIVVLLVKLFGSLDDTDWRAESYPQVHPVAAWPAYSGAPGVVAGLHGGVILGGRS